MLTKVSAILKIIRPLNCLMVFVSTIAAGIISQSTTNINYNLVLAAIAAFLTGGAGNVINDFFDYEIDKINRPKRVLPLGLLSKNQALILYFVLVFISFCIGLYLNIVSYIILVFTNIVLLIYSIKLKKIILAGNITIAFFTGLTFVFGAAVVNNVAGGIIPAVFAFFINIIREIIKDIEDIEGDVKQKIYTFPYVFGEKRTNIIILILSLLLIVFTIFPFYYGIYKIEFFIIVMTIVNPLLVYTNKLVFTTIDKAKYTTSSKLLKFAMVIGLVAIYVGK